MKKILIGITGSIAAYKTPELIRNLVSNGFEVKMVLTESAESFVTPITLQAVSGGSGSVHTQLLDYNAEAAMSHIELARWADVILVAPASANFIAKFAAGLCDNLLNTICLASSAPVVIAPAMNKHMWEHPATQDNIYKLRSRNVIIWGPGNGVQACGDIGLGRMIEPMELVQSLINLTMKQTLSGLNILITAGATHEMIDPVRFITNKSSGKMGYALVEEAIKMGAKVTLVTGGASIPIPYNCDHVIQVNTADEMLNAVTAQVLAHDIFISSAAVSDYKVVNPQVNKIKRDSNQSITLTLESNVDILAKIGSEYNTFSVGFAAETENLLINAKTKLINKKVDLIIANDVSNPDIGFNSDYNEVYIISKIDTLKIERSSKPQIAKKILQYVYKSYVNSGKYNITNAACIGNNCDAVKST
ncbi:MAG: phosphopantothenoylcysteine decarboxylase / phosphopantothenate---cysteine ligase [Pseudomonadota bacterium]|nr:phosphopantothenoylcysteine decarboxylase / phosphopantothenate---cysteine ligase [Pseudomonadota bacterium]